MDNSKRFYMLVVFLKLFGTVAGVKTACDDNWIAFQGSCYLFGLVDHDYLEANKLCEHQNAHLVRIDNADENSFIHSWMVRLKGARFWIGLNDLLTEGVWQWYDTDLNATYFDWFPGEPNQNTAANCVAIRDDHHYKWIDDPCNLHWKALCEKTNHNINEIIG